MWANYQILDSISYSIGVPFPGPSRKFFSALSVVSIDFISFDCIFGSSNPYMGVYIWSSGVIVVSLINGVVYLARHLRIKLDFRWNGEEHKRLVREHTFAFLFLTYLLVPPITRMQLQAMNCIIVNGRLYMRSNTMVECTAPGYKAFRVLDTLFVIIYMTLPFIWCRLLYRKREKLNPSSSNLEEALELRSTFKGLEPLSFLFSPYMPRCIIVLYTFQYLMTATPSRPPLQLLRSV